MYSRLISAVCVVLISACGPAQQAGGETLGQSPQQLIDFPEFETESSRWFTLVMDQPIVPKGAPEAQATAMLKANGADEVVWLNEIGVAFAHFNHPDDTSKLKGVKIASTTVSSLAPMRAYGVPGSLTPSDVHKYGKSALVQKPKLLATTATPADSLAQSTWGVRRIKADKVWPTATGSHKTVVAVVDTGIATNHPDLAPNIVHTSCNTWSKLRGKACQSAYPTTHWHATHVAGTIAAAFGGGKVIGVGPNLGLASYNVFENLSQTADFDDDGKQETLMFSAAFDSNILAAVLDAANRGFQVINLSLGSVWAHNPGDEIPSLTAWNRAANYAAQKGSVLVVSAGNNGDFEFPGFGLIGDLDNPRVTGVPAEAVGPGVLTVGATGIRPQPSYPFPGSFDVRTFYSSFGSAVDVAAPGGDLGPTNDDGRYEIVSSSILLDPFMDSFLAWQMGLPYTPAEPECAVAENCTPVYHGSSGTSMAAPHVSGSVGLLVDQGVRAIAAAQILKASADKTALPADAKIGNLIDVEAALKAVRASKP